MKFLLQITVAILSAISCNRASTALLDEVESYIKESPEASLTALKSADTASYTPEQRARAALLICEALDRTGMLTDSSIYIRQARNWFMHHGTDAQKMKALYYEGKALKRSGNNIAAVNSFSAAEKYSYKIRDHYYSGLICSEISSVYSLSSSHNEALRYAAKAYSCFERSGSSKEQEYTRYEMARCYNNLRQYGRCEAICRDILRKSMLDKDTSLAVKCTEIYISSLVYRDEPRPEEAIRLYTFLTDSLKASPGIRTANDAAGAYIMMGMTDKASEIIGNAAPQARDAIEKAVIAMGRHDIEKSAGNYREALEHYTEAVKVQDSLFRMNLSQSIAGAQRDFYKEEAAMNGFRLKKARQTTILSILLGVVTAISASIIIYMLDKRRNRERASLMGRLAEANEEMESIRSEYDRTVSDFSRQIASLYALKFGFLDDICRQYYSYEATSTRQRHILKAVDKGVSMLADDNEFSSLEKIINTYKDNVMEKARKEFPKFREEEFRLLCYWCAGFSAATISLLTHEDDVNSVYRKKSRLKSKIERSSSPLRDEILGKLL